MFDNKMYMFFPQCRDLLRVVTSYIMCSRSLGPLLAATYGVESVEYFARNIQYLRNVETNHRDSGGSIQGFFRQFAALMLCQLERLEIAEIAKKKEEAAGKEGVGKEGVGKEKSKEGSKEEPVEEPVEEPIVYQVSYLGHVIGDRAKKFYDGLKMKHWFREDGGHWTPDLVTWEALAMGPARIMCQTGKQMSMTDQREITTRVNEKKKNCF